MTSKNWRLITHGVEGSMTVFGADIFKYEWERTGEYASVKDPLYGRSLTFSVYRTVIDGRTYEFAAGEFSNMVWGFYTRE